MDERNPPIQIRRNVSLNKDDIDWLERAYGNDVSLSWALGLMLQAFREAHTYSPEDYAKIAAGIVVKNIEEQL